MRQGHGGPALARRSPDLSPEEQTVVRHVVGTIGLVHAVGEPDSIDFTDSS